MAVYEFDDDRRAIVIHRHDTPSPWINYLSNGRMHAFVSQAGGGFAWWRNPILYRLTRYRQHNLPPDSPGFYIYLRRGEGEVWSPTFRPCQTPLDAWSATHQPGRTTFQARRNGLEARLSLFVAPDHDALVWDLHLVNRIGDPMELDVFAYVEFSQLLWQAELFAGYYWRHMLKTWFDAESASLLYLFHSSLHPRIDEVPLVYLAGTEPVAGYSGDRDAFVGPYRDERDPLGVERGCAGNGPLAAGEPCGALHHKLVLPAGEPKRLGFFLGVVPGALVRFQAARAELARELEALRAPGAVDAQRGKVEAWWSEHLGVYDCSIPDAAAQRQISIWSPVNSVHTARYSRSVNANAPGVRGVGFRDTCQDMLAMAYRKPAWAEETLLFLLANQYEDGHVVHTIHPGEDRLPDTGLHSDNHLWLPFLARAILAETGDLALLAKQVPFLAADSLGAARPAGVWEHLLAAVRFTEAHLGAHGLPLTLKGDWNDIIGKFSRQGRGESVFAGQQYVLALRYLIELAEMLGDAGHLAWLHDCLQRQQRNLLAHAWDGAWWRRGFDDDGNPVGSKSSRFGKLFLNPQSWAVLSGVGDPAQLRAAMDAVSEHLDTGMGLKKLMPGFPTWPEASDPFTGYGPGCGENGAIFCQANTWAIMAEAILGNGTRAWKYFTQMIPHLALEKAGLEVYQAEPYAWVSNIVGPENPRFGWANVAQITGTAAWMDVAATQYLLGVRPEPRGLRIDPCTPRDWRQFSVSRLYRGCRVEIEVRNPEGVEKGIKSMAVDGAAVDLGNGPVIPAEVFAGKEKAAVQVVMG